MSRLSENAIKLNEKINNLRTILRPAIEAALSRVNANVRNKDDDALLEAGRILGVE